MLAWIPFLQPAPGVPGWWWALVFPLAFLMSMTWKSIRQDDMSRYWPAVLRMSVQVVLGMLGLALLVGVLLGVSRKSFIGKIADVPNPKQRLAGSLAAMLHGLDQGVDMVRVHDVAETVQAVALWRALRHSTA